MCPAKEGEKPCPRGAGPVAPKLLCLLGQGDHKLVSRRERGCLCDEVPRAWVGFGGFIYDFPWKRSALVWGGVFAFVFTLSLQAWLGGPLTCWPLSLQARSRSLWAAPR